MGKDTRAARCRTTAFDELECTIPFDRGLIEAWKASVPYSRRSYDPASKAWRFWGGYQDVAISLLLGSYPGAEIPLRPHRWREAGHDERADHFTTLHLLPTAPNEVVDAAYRALAKMHHPDRGGDPAVMRRLTEAREALGRRLSA